MTKAQSAANYVFGLRRLKPAVEEDPSKPPHDGDESGRGPPHVATEDLTFCYETRPSAKVLDGINIDVSPRKYDIPLIHMLTTVGASRGISRYGGGFRVREIYNVSPNCTGQVLGN